MWILFAIIALVFYACADVIGKKCIGDCENVTPKLIIVSEMLAFCVSIFMYVFRLGESGKAPWQLISENPLIVINVLTFVSCTTFFLFALKFVGLSVNEAFSGTTGILYFIGIVAVNLFTGKLSQVSDLLKISRLVPILIVLIFMLIFSLLGKSQKSTIFGLALVFISIVLDTADSLITTIILDGKGIGSVDYIMTSWFANGLPLVIFLIYLRIKERKWFNPIKAGRYYYLYAFLAIGAAVLYVIASSFDAVRTGIIFVIYPILPILGAKIILKEKYKLLQNICIWVITIGAIAFCVIDGLL